MKIIKKLLITLFILIMSINNLFALTHEQLTYKLLLNNAILQNSKKDIKLASLDVKDAKAAYQPKVEFLTTSTFMVNPPIGKIVVTPEDYLDGQTGTSGTLSPLSSLGLDGPITVYQGMEDTYYNFDIKITQPLYTWGKINTSVKIYNKIVEIKKIKSNSLSKQLSSELEAREAAIYYLKQMNTNLKEQKEISNELINIVREAYYNNLVVEQDLLEAQIKAKQIDIGIKEIEKEESIQLSQIIKLTNDNNISVEEIEYIFDESKVNSILSNTKKQLIDKSVSLNSDNIKMLNILDEVNKDQIEIAKNSIYYKPDLALQIDTSYSGYRLPLIEKGYYTKDQSSLNISIAIKTTLWDGGKKLNDVIRKNLNEEKSKNEIIIAKNEIAQKVSENLYNLQLATSNIEYQELKAQIIQNNLENLQKEYNQGLIDKTPILKKQLEKKACQINIYKEQINRAQSYFTILYLIE